MTQTDELKRWDSTLMGAQIEKLDDGQEIAIHKFDTKAQAEHYMTVSREYVYERHEPWAFTDGFDFYQGPAPGLRGCIRYREGLQWVAPWRSVYAASTQVQSRTYKELDSFSSETQNVFVQATVNFHVSPDHIQQLYRTVGPNYADVLIDPRVHQDFKDGTVKYSSVDIAPHREDIRKDVRSRITAELRDQSIIVDDVLLKNISFSKQFEGAIENKQIASQNALAEQQNVAVSKQKAQQAIEAARGAAESSLIKAQKEAEANDLLTKSITPQLVQYLAVQKLNPNVSVMMIPAGQQFILGSDTLKAIAK